MSPSFFTENTNSDITQNISINKNNNSQKILNLLLKKKKMFFNNDNF